MDDPNLFNMTRFAADRRMGRPIPPRPMCKGGGRPCVRWVIVVCVLGGLAALASAPTFADDEAAPREYDVKAAFIYNFMIFVDGLPFQGDDRDEQATAGNGSEPNETEPIRIGIIGEDPFDNAFEVVVKRRIKDRRIVIVHFKGLFDPNGTEEPVRVHPQIERIKKCDLIFLCASEQPYVDVLLKPIRTMNILTVADRPGLLEKGVIINFVTEYSKVRFDVNLIAAKEAKLEIRSKLLRLAKRIIE